MAERKKEQANTEQKDYKAKARGKYPDDEKYPVTEQHKQKLEKPEKSAARNNPKDVKKTYHEPDEKNPAAPDKISTKKKTSSISKDQELAGQKYHRNKNKDSRR